MKSNKKRMFWSIAFIAAFTITIFTISYATLTDPCNGSIKVSASWAFDVSDRELLVESSDNVFVGEVIEEIGPNPLTLPPSIFALDKSSFKPPHMLFNVKVLETLKGKPMEQMVVNQQAGYCRGDRDKPVLFEDDPLLIPGQVYLFSTTSRTEQIEGREQAWHTFTPNYGDIPLSALGETERDSLIQEFREIVNLSENVSAGLDAGGLLPAPVLGIVVDQGMKVVDVEPNSAADQAGLQMGDVINAIDFPFAGERLTFDSVSPQRRPLLLKRAKTLLAVQQIGDTYAVIISRNGSAMTIEPNVLRPPTRINRPTATPVFELVYL